MDGRTPSGQGGGVLILQAVLMDSHAEWGRKRGFRPRWLRSILATNRAHVKKHGHALVLRWAATEPQLTDWQISSCNQRGFDTLRCTKEWQRENFNWEKHLMLAEYLHSAEKFTHVMMLDADAALVRPDHNTLQLMADELDKAGKDVFMSDEDWIKHGKGRINGGLIFVKNTPFTRNLFNDTFDAHRASLPIAQWRIGVRNTRCGSNEQICLNDLLHGGQKEFAAPKAMVTSGMIWNRGGCVLHHCGEGMSDTQMKVLGMQDPSLEIMHFMGGSKQAAPAALCDDYKDLTGDGPSGYGCRLK